MESEESELITALINVPIDLPDELKVDDLRYMEMRFSGFMSGCLCGKRTINALIYHIEIENRKVVISMAFVRKGKDLRVSLDECIL